MAAGVMRTNQLPSASPPQPPTSRLAGATTSAVSSAPGNAKLYPPHIPGGIAAAPCLLGGLAKGFGFVPLAASAAGESSRGINERRRCCSGGGASAAAGAAAALVSEVRAVDGSVDQRSPTVSNRHRAEPQLALSPHAYLCVPRDHQAERARVCCVSETYGKSQWHQIVTSLPHLRRIPWSGTRDFRWVLRRQFRRWGSCAGRWRIGARAAAGGMSGRSCWSRPRQSHTPPRRT